MFSGDFLSIIYYILPPFPPQHHLLSTKSKRSQQCNKFFIFLSLSADDESISLNSNSPLIHSSPAIRPKVASFIRTHKLIFLSDFRWSFSTVCWGTAAMNLPWLTSRTQVISHSFAMIFVPNEAPLELSTMVIPGQKKCAHSATRRVHKIVKWREEVEKKFKRKKIV